MTKHRPEFAQRVQPEADSALMELVNRIGFILETPRTRVALLALVADGKLKRRQRTVTRDDGSKRVIFRYTKG